MIHSLHTLMRKYVDKKIYIWDIERDSICLFMKVAFRGINISGFVTSQEVYVGEMYMNRPVVALKQVKKEKDSIILLHDSVPKKIIKNLPIDKTVYWKNVQEIDEKLRQKKIIIYGVGKKAAQLDEKLAGEGIIAELYCVTKGDPAVQKFRGKKVITVDELKEYEEYALLIATDVPRYRMEILYDFCGEIYMDVEGFVDCDDRTNLIQSIDLAIKKFRKIYFYGQKNKVAELLEKCLNIYGIEIDGYVYEKADEEQRIQNIYELAYEGVRDKLVIITEEIPEYIVAARENIEFAGFSLGEENYTGVQWHTRAKEMLLSEWQVRSDPLLGWSVYYPQDKPGWKIYGKEEKDRVRILVLGGSTSSEEYSPPNWVSKLYNKLNKNVKTTIYNGAHPGNDIVDEILRLLRDGYILQPQIVISMSGINNCYRKESVNQFNEERLIDWVKFLSPDREYYSGVDTDESQYFFWSRNMRLLNLISNYYGARFFGFLQPIDSTMSQMTLRERSLYADTKNKLFCDDFRKSANDKDGYINLLHLLQHQDGMTFDGCHYTEEAHEIIASKVYEIIMPTVQTLFFGGGLNK